MSNLSNVIDDIFRDVVSDGIKKGKKWQNLTKTQMVSVSPYETKNLREAISVFDMEKKGDEYVFDVAVSTSKILPPPSEKLALKGRRKGKMVKMSDYDYTDEADSVILATKSEGYIGYNFLERWEDIAEKTIERVFR